MLQHSHLHQRTGRERQKIIAREQTTTAMLQHSHLHPRTGRQRQKIIAREQIIAMFHGRAVQTPIVRERRTTDREHRKTIAREHRKTIAREQITLAVLQESLLLR